MHKKWNGLLALVFLAIGLTAWIGCGGGGGGNDSTASASGTINGTVVDMDSGAPLSGVTITVSDGTTGGGAALSLDFPVSATSEADGSFEIDAPVTDRAVVTFSKSGYVFTCRVTPVLANDTSYLPEAAMAVVSSQAFNTIDGGTFSDAMGGRVIIDPNALVDADSNAYSGAATVEVQSFNPTRSADLNAFPGEFQGLNSDGVMVPFQSYGFMDITVRDSGGNLLNLSDGATAAITIPIPSGLSGSAPATIPLWYFNPADGVWHQEGALTKNGDIYEGEVSHFSMWNADHPYDRGWVTGRVIDGSDRPIAGAIVYIKGVSPRNNWMMSGMTDGDGYFPANPTAANPGIPVEADSTCQIWVKKSGITNEPVLFSGPGVNQTMAYPDIVWTTYEPPPPSDYSEIVLAPYDGIDFSEGTSGPHFEMPAADGAMELWTEEDYTWFHMLSDFDYSYVKDMGAVALKDVTAWPGDWEPTGATLLIQEGHSYVVKCQDGYAKFYVVSTDDIAGVEIQYLYSTTSVFTQ